jgi:TonB family protein
VAYADVTVGASGEIKNVLVRSSSPSGSTTSSTSSAHAFIRQHETAIGQVVHKWKFAPARSRGVAIEATARVPVLLLAALPVPKPVPEGITLLKPLKQTAAIYPREMEDSGQQGSGVTGQVTLEFALDAKGRPQNPVVVLSPDKRFDAPALDAIRQWRFETPDPAKPDSLGNTYAKLSDARWQCELNFVPSRIRNRAFRETQRATQDSTCGTFRTRLAAAPVMSTSITPAGARTNGQDIPRPVLAPASVSAVAPVYPHELLIRNITGRATARLPCDTGWPETRPEIINSSYRNFGYALAAAMRYCAIEADLWSGKPAPSMLTVTFDFNPANPDLHLPPGTMQLLADETQNPEKIIDQDKLDAPLTYQGAPPLPSLYVDDELKGVTVVEFLVDETGRVHLPRILQTETLEAACILVQEISMRAYAPPLQNGKPVVARARETLDFEKPQPGPAGK